MLSKAKPTYMRPVLEDAISKGAFTRDARKAARWALVTIDDLTARLVEAEKKYDELKHVVECNKKLLIENDGLRLSLAAAEAALKPFAEVARGIPDNWPGECHLRIDGEPVQLGDFIGCREWLCYHGVQDVQDACLPTIEQWREAAKAGGRDGRRM